MNDAPPAISRLNSSGEMEFDMEGRPYVLRPSMDAMEAIERQTDRAIIDLANAARSGSLKLAELSIIVAETVKAWGREATAESEDIQRDAAKLTPAGVRPFIYDGGIAQVNARLAVLLSGAVSGGYDSFGKARGAWAAQLAEAGRKAQTPPIPAAD